MTTELSKQHDLHRHILSKLEGLEQN
jgi:hypothetical protein